MSNCGPGPRAYRLDEFGGQRHGSCTALHTGAARHADTSKRSGENRREPDIDSFLYLAHRVGSAGQAPVIYVAGRGDDDKSGFASAPSARGGHRSSIAAFSSVTKAATVEIQRSANSHFAGQSRGHV